MNAIRMSRFTLAWILSWVLLLPPTVSAAGLRLVLEDLARQAGVDLVLDSAVDGRVEGPLRAESPLDRLVRTAESAGYPVMVLSRASGRALAVVGPSAGQRIVGPLRPGAKHHPHLRPEVERKVVVEAMLMLVSRPLLGELRAYGTQPVGNGPQGRSSPDFLSGIGPGIRALLFRPADAILNGKLPWSVTGAVSDSRFEVLSRDRYQVSPGGSFLLPLETFEIHTDGDPLQKKGVLKEAIQITPQLDGDGRVRLDMSFSRTLNMPEDFDSSLARGGRTQTSIVLEIGGEALVLGLGQRHIEAVDHGRVDPFENRRRKRLGDRNTNHRHPVIPMELVIRLMVRVD